MSCPKADDFTANSAFLRTRDKGMSNVVQVVVWKYVFEMFCQRVQRNGFDMIQTVKNPNFIFESSKFFATLLAIMCARRLVMNYFYRMEESLMRCDKKLKAWGKRQKRKTPKQKKRALQKRCAQIEKQSKHSVSQETFQEYYEEIFRNGTSSI